MPADDLLGLTGSGFPFFRAGWGHNVAGAFLGDHTDWTEIAELLTGSYCEMAPKFLAARVGPRRPDPPGSVSRPAGHAPADRLPDQDSRAVRISPRAVSIHGPLVRPGGARVERRPRR